MCREKMCPHCAHNEWELIEMPRPERNKEGQFKTHFLLRCRNCGKVYISGEYWAPIKYPILTEDFDEIFNPSRRNHQIGRKANNVHPGPRKS